MFENFAIRGFAPEKGLKDYAEGKLSWLLKIVPENSRLSFKLERQGIGYRLDLLVSSGAGVFSDQALANDARVAIDRLNTRISDRLSHWLVERREIPFHSLFSPTEAYVCKAAS